MSNASKDAQKIEVLESLLGRIQKNTRTRPAIALALPEGDGQSDPSLLAYKQKLAQRRSGAAAPVATPPRQRPIARVFVPAASAAQPAPAPQPTPAAQPKPAPQPVIARQPAPAPHVAPAPQPQRIPTPKPMPAPAVQRMATPMPAPAAQRIATPMPSPAVRPMATPAPQAVAARPVQTPMPQAVAKAVPRTKTLLMGRPMATPEPTPAPPQVRAQPIATPLPDLAEPLPMPAAPSVQGPRRSDSTPTLNAASIDTETPTAIVAAPAFEPIAPSRMVQISGPAPEPQAAPLSPDYDESEVTRVGYTNEPLPPMAIPTPQRSAVAAPVQPDLEPMAPPPGIEPMEPSAPPAPAPMPMAAPMPMHAPRPSPSVAPAPLVSQPLPPHLTAKSAPPPVKQEGRGWWLAAVVLLLFAAALFAAYHFNYLPLR